MDGEPDFSVVLPAFNEAADLHAHLHAVARALAGRPLEIVVVDDGSTDGTHEQALRAAADGLPVRAIRSAANRGKGAALAMGFAAARGSRVAFLDADLEIAPEHLLELERVMEASGADGVVAVRDTEGGTPASRRVMSVLYRRLVAFLFDLPLRETQAGAKLFRREVLEACVPRLAARRFAFDVELLVACQRFGFTVVQAPVHREFKRASGGRIGLRHALGMLAETLGVYRRASFLRWLQPGARLGLWSALLAFGLVLLGIGLGKLVTPLVLRGPVADLFYYAALQFLPRALRDALLVLGGGMLAALAAVELNKGVLRAFARRDAGDLAGIWRRSR